MDEITKDLDARLADRMAAFTELAILRDKVAGCLADIESLSEQAENKFMQNAAKSILPAAHALISSFGFPLVEIMLDGDPRYYGEEEE